MTTADRKPGDFGTKLREARERRGVTLRQIANDTKISMTALEALERNDISRLPGGIFSRSFVRTYAVYVGLDPEEAVDDFVRQFPHETVTVGHATSDRSHETESFESNQRVASVGLKLAGISVPIAGLVLYFATRPSPVREPAPVSAAPPAAARPATDTRPTEPRVTSEPIATAGEALRFEVTATRGGTLSVAVDGESPIDFALEGGGRRRIEFRRELMLRTSDAAAFTWSINGRPGRPLGASGAPTTLTLTAANYETYLSAR